MQHLTEEMQQLAQAIRENIRDHGCARIAITNEGTGLSPYIYTVGLHEKHLPELIILGALPFELRSELLYSVYTRWLSQRKAELGIVPGLIQNARGERLPVELRLVDPTVAATTFMLNLPLIYPQRDYEVVQILWPDAEGRLPDHPDFKVGMQPVLPTYVRPTCDLH